GHDFASRVGTLVVTLHHAGTLGEDLAVFSDTNEHVGNGLARAADAVGWIVRGEHGRSLGEAVALGDGDTDGPEKLGEISRQWSASGKNDAQLTASADSNFRIDELVGECPLQLQSWADGLQAGAPRRGLFGDGHRPVE